MPKITFIFLGLTLVCFAANTYTEIKYKEAKRIYAAHSGLFVDARDLKLYKKGTILGAIDMPFGRFNRLKRLLPAKKSSKLIVFCNGLTCKKSTQLAEKIVALGYKRVMVFRGGYPEWRKMGQEVMLSTRYCQSSKKPKRVATIQNTTVSLGSEEGVIDAEWFSEQLEHNSVPKNIALVDVRSAKEFKKGHIPNALHIRWDGDRGTIDSNSFPKDKLILLYCNTGLLSSDAYDSLNEETVKNVLFLNAQVKCRGEECTIDTN